MKFTTDTALYRVIGSNIKFFSQQTKLSQAQLAEEAQISISYLSKIEASGCDKNIEWVIISCTMNIRS